MHEEVIKWIEDSIRAHGLVAQRLPVEAAKQIQGMATEIYVNNTPRSWWMSLKTPPMVLDSSQVSLSQVLPQTGGRCWLIPENEQVPLPVFDVAVNDVQPIIEDCPFFEYYVLAQDYGWLVIESDHNEFFVCKRSDR